MFFALLPMILSKKDPVALPSSTYEAPLGSYKSPVELCRMFLLTFFVVTPSAWAMTEYGALPHADGWWSCSTFPVLAFSFQTLPIRMLLAFTNILGAAFPAAAFVWHLIFDQRPYAPSFLIRNQMAPASAVPAASAV